MDFLRGLLGKRGSRTTSSQEYERLTEDADTSGLEPSEALDHYAGREEEVPFSWVEYAIFGLLGMAMLWAWNMFLAAAVYFHKRFEEDKWVADNFQSAILTVSTITNLVVMWILTNMQQKASYPFRINLALLVNTVTFSMLAASTIFMVGASPSVYLVFVLVMVALTAYATGLIQNGAFAFAASFGRSEYMQALMAGQGVADTGSSSGTSAFVYFLTAVAVSLAALLAFIPLAKRHNQLVEARLGDRMAESMASVEEAERSARKVITPKQLFVKLHWLSLAIIVCFAATMFFPVFTAKIQSVRGDGDDSDLFYLAFVQLLFGLTNGWLGSSCMMAAGEWVDEGERRPRAASWGSASSWA
ncbi:unnamed protein product [Parascedosporium putredinis]|uniref:Uncharacterized protein n=1 Tax=Parascedosporium putredinis TaxID=1442378 RepID=A0A9P1M8D4_9PEZI|nr:unnamed protein product [Parascedosporium putredinis]CAI7988684.1 unnamed protein product [Parascedosporium putredinis]